MTAAQPAYDYVSYDYGYDANTASNYPSYGGYESGAAAYAAHGTYDGYAAAATAYPPGTSSSAYASVDPYSGYHTASYAYSAPAAPGAPPATSGQTGYPSSYTSTATTAGYPYESRRTTPPPTTPTAAHYASYEYASATYPAAPPSSAAYSPYKPAPVANGASSATAYSTYPPPAPAPPPHGAYAVPPGSHLSSTMGPPPPPHVYGPPPSAAAAGMVPRRPDYYHPPPMTHSMHYVSHQPQSTPYRLPPRGGYQRELDEPGDENALLRHVIYITGLPKEIQNETLAEVFGAVCGQIAPVDVRSPKPKIWVYKDRQTREGKGEATITFVNPESCQTAISYFNGKELFGREIRVTLCPRRMYNMQKQNTPFNPAAPPVNTNTAIKSINTINNSNITTTNTTDSTAAAATTTTTTVTPATSSAAAATTSASAATTTTTTATTTTTTSSSTLVTAANPIATISSSTLGLPRQLNHSLFKLRQTPEQQRGLLPTPPIPYGAPMMGTAIPRDGVRKELPRIALNRGNYINPTGVRPKPY